MDYGMIGKIQKSKHYAEEKHRFQFQQFELTFDGDNNPHTIKFSNGAFHCDCEFFISHHHCAHTMALEAILKGMLPEPVIEDA